MTQNPLKSLIQAEKLKKSFRVPLKIRIHPLNFRNSRIFERTFYPSVEILHNNFPYNAKQHQETHDDLLHSTPRNVVANKNNHMEKIIIVLTTTILTLLPQIALTQNDTFVPKDFEVPAILQNEYFRIRMLTVNDFVKDYDAVMTSISHLQEMFLPIWNWPTENLTFEQDLIDLGWHQKEFQMRNSFAYTVVSLDESKVLGCLYIYPTKKAKFDAEIYMWVRHSEVEKGLDAIVFTTVKKWIDRQWPFKNPAYPVREITMDNWMTIE